MNYEKSMKQIFSEIRGWKESLAEIQEELFLTMTGIDDDIGFAMANHDFDHAEVLQSVFDNLSLILDCYIPTIQRMTNRCLQTLSENMKEGENAEEHKTTTER